MSKRAWILLALITGLVAAEQVSAQAFGRQSADPGVREVTRAHAITNATVIPEPGQVIEGATVVLRDGVIVAVGTDVDVPVDARVIEGDTLFVYAAFIDALGTAGLDVPEVESSERVANPDDPPRDRAGLLPDRLARDYFDPSSSSVERLRATGFAAAHVAPWTGMLSGTSAVVLLGGERAEEAVLVPEAAQTARFASASGVYPSTPMGVAATLREVVHRARQYAEIQARYAADPAGRSRPHFDPVSEAIRSVAAGEQPLYFVVDDVLEAGRALHLGRDLELPLVLAGIPESSSLINRLIESDVAVLAPLALPDTVDADDPIAHEEVARHAGRIFSTTHRTRTHQDVEEEKVILEQRRQIAVVQHERNAAALSEAGIPFAFASLDESPADFRENLRRMIEAGLSADDALAALTTTPAQLLGLERTLGTVEAGRMANLLITDGDYFAENTNIRHVFVDGRRYDIDEEDRPREDPDAEVIVLGTWDLTVLIEDSSISGTMEISGDDDEPVISIQTPETGRLSAQNVTLVGNRLSFVLPVTPIGRVEVSGLITDDRYEADVEATDVPPSTLTATRRPNDAR